MKHRWLLLAAVVALSGCAGGAVQGTERDGDVLREWRERYPVVVRAGLRYAGDVRDGKPHGRGVLVVPGSGGYHYEGEFRDGAEHGHGVKTGLSLGSSGAGWRYEGGFRAGLLHGAGVLVKGPGGSASKASGAMGCCKGAASRPSRTERATSASFAIGLSMGKAWSPSRTAGATWASGARGYRTGKGYWCSRTGSVFKASGGEGFRCKPVIEPRPLRRRYRRRARCRYRRDCGGWEVAGRRSTGGEAAPVRARYLPGSEPSGGASLPRIPVPAGDVAERGCPSREAFARG